jgi:hypothetical protein
MNEDPPRTPFLPHAHAPAFKTKRVRSFQIVFSLIALYHLMFFPAYVSLNWAANEKDQQMPVAVLARAVPQFDPALEFVNRAWIEPSAPRCPDFAAYASGARPSDERPSGFAARVDPVHVYEASHAHADTRFQDLTAACMRAAMNVSRPDNVAYVREVFAALPSDMRAGEALGWLAIWTNVAPLSLRVALNPANLLEPIVEWGVRSVALHPGVFDSACRALVVLDEFPYEVYGGTESCAEGTRALHATLGAMILNHDLDQPELTFDYYRHGAAQDTYSAEQLGNRTRPQFVADAVAAVQRMLDRHHAEIAAAGRSVPVVRELSQWTTRTGFLSAAAAHGEVVHNGVWRAYAKTMFLIDSTSLLPGVLHGTPPVLQPGTNLTLAAHRAAVERCAWLAMNYLPHQSSAIARGLRESGDVPAVAEKARNALVRYVNGLELDGRAKLEFTRKVYGLRIVHGADEPTALDAPVPTPSHPSLHRLVGAARAADFVRPLVAKTQTVHRLARRPIEYLPHKNALHIAAEVGFPAEWPETHVMGTLGFELVMEMLQMASEDEVHVDHKGEVDMNPVRASRLFASRDVAAAQIALMACTETERDAAEFMLALAQHLSDDPQRANRIAAELRFRGTQPWCVNQE